LYFASESRTFATGKCGGCGRASREQFLAQLITDKANMSLEFTLPSQRIGSRARRW
jgi:hypothetical protein